MRLILGHPPKKIPYRIYAAIGVYDGLHRGHTYILERLKRQASEAKAKTLLVTFSPYPQDFLKKRFAGYLTNLEEKAALVSKMGIDYLWVIKFNKDFYLKDGRGFIRYINKYFNLVEIIAGSDFRFGYRQRCDILGLKRIADSFKFKLEVVEHLKERNTRISSSRIRSLVKKGSLGLAEKLMGRRYHFISKVVEMDKKASLLLGIPTANLEVFSKVLPPFGVYLSLAEYRGKVFPSLSFLGGSPTFGRKKIVLETHLFGFRNSLYGKVIKVSLVRSLREIRNFKNVNELKEAIAVDLQRAKKYFSRHNMLY